MSLERTNRSDIKTIRDKMLVDEEKLASKQRFGLFSSLPPIALGDDTYEPQKKSRVNADGKILTAPRNLLAGPSRAGKVKSSYFSVPDPIKADPYIDPSKLQKIKELPKIKIPEGRPVFKPADTYKTKVKPPYAYKEEGARAAKVAQKDGNGKVITGPKNIVTNPARQGHYNSTVGHLLQRKPDEHMKDEYERKRILELQAAMEKKKKLQPNPFKSTIHGNKPFTKAREVFGADGVPVPKPRAKTPEPKKFHENPFKPANPTKEGYEGYFTEFPQWKPDPMKILVRKKEDEASKKPAFKPRWGQNQAKPSPSVSCNYINLRKEMSAHYQTSVFLR